MKEETEVSSPADGYGYFGHWNAQVKANPDSFKKVQTPEGKRTTLIIRVIENGFNWRCKECDEEMVTTHWVRPLHTCKTA